MALRGAVANKAISAVGGLVMRAKRPSAVQVQALLAQPHFGQERTAPASSDPIATTPMLVPVADIDYYDRNPRRVPNGQFDQIKRSIAIAGMEQPLTITRRPGAPRYMVFKGGNTRLRALKELSGETADERFERIHCIYVPWTSETDALLGHLKENDLRGDLCFIDRALAVRELRVLLEADSGRQISQRQLSDALNERGYSVGRTMIQWMDYAVDVLHAALPLALNSGIGRPQVERIRGLERAFTECWRALGLVDPGSGVDETVQAVFVELLARHDGEALDLDLIRRELEIEVSVTADIDVQRASLLVGAALDGRPLGSLSDGAASTPVENDDPGEERQEPASEKHAEQPQMTSSQLLSPPPDDAKGNVRSPPSSTDDTNTAISGAAKDTDGTQGTHRQGSSASSNHEQVASDQLPAFREEAATLATEMAVAARMGDAIIYPIAAGAGFLVGPTALISEDLISDEHLKHLVYLWWSLAQVSEQFADGSRAAEYMPADWATTPFKEAVDHAGTFTFFRWHSLVDEANAPVVWEAIPLATLPGFGPLMWPQLSEAVWQTFQRLVDVYRAIHRVTGGNMWG